MKALVTGGTGFVGSHVARALAAEGHSVRVLHRASSKLTLLEGVPFEGAPGDIRDAASLRAACEGCDWVFHVAAVSDYWRSTQDEIIEANVRGTKRVLQAAKEAGVRRVVFTSSAAAVGLHADGSPSDESDGFNGSSARFPYAYSKAMAEVVCQEAVSGGQDVVIVNPVVVIGPGDVNRISGELILSVAQLGPAVPVPPGGVAISDVRDIARWHVRAAEKGITGERTILGTVNMPYAEMFARIAAVVNVPAPGFPIPASVLPLAGTLIDLARALGLPVKLDGTQTRLSARPVYFTFDKAWAAYGPPEYTTRQTLADAYAWYDDRGLVRRSTWLTLIGR